MKTHCCDPVAAWAFHIHEVGVWVLNKKLSRWINFHRFMVNIWGRSTHEIVHTHVAVHLDQTLQLVLPLFILGQWQQQLLGKLDIAKVRKSTEENQYHERG